MNLKKIVLILGILGLFACTTKNNSMSNSPGGTDGPHTEAAGGNQATNTGAAPAASPSATP